MSEFTEEKTKYSISHMNEDHMEANLIYVQAWSDIKDATKATMKTLSAENMTFDVLDKSGKMHNDVVVKFENKLSSLEQAHHTLVALVGKSLKKLGAGAYREKDIAMSVKSLMSKTKILHLSTVDDTGQTEIGYTQFVGDQNKVYVMMSEMTNHCKNILNGHNKISVMFTQNENDAQELSALERFTAQAVVNKIECDSKLWNDTKEKLVARCGKIYNNFAKMGDFHMFEFELKDARHVIGFGLAFDRIAGKWGAVRGGGHKKRK